MGEVSDDQCQLMVQLMESWLVADRDALRAFYGPGLNENPLPGLADVELIDKADVLGALEDATRRTQKGRYHKIRHGAKLMGRVDVDRVRRAARHCDRLFRTVAGKMEATI